MPDLRIVAPPDGRPVFRVERHAPAQHGDRVERAYYEVVWGAEGRVVECGHRHSSSRRAQRCLDRHLGVSR